MADKRPRILRLKALLTDSFVDLREVVVRAVRHDVRRDSMRICLVSLRDAEEFRRQRSEADLGQRVGRHDRHDRDEAQLSQITVTGIQVHLTSSPQQAVA